MGHIQNNLSTDLSNKNYSQSLGKLYKTQLLESIAKGDNYVVNNAYDYLYRTTVV